MVEFVRDDGIFWTEQCFEQTAIGVETGTVENRVFGSQKLRYRPFQLLMNTLCAADKAHTGHAISPAIQSFMGRFDDLRMFCQAEIIVGAHVEDFTSTSNADVRVLWGINNAFTLESTRFSDLLQSLSELLGIGSHHDG